MLQGGPDAVAIFEQDLDQTFQRIRDRCVVLREKSKDLDETNTNLTPEQAKAFKTFPKYFQDALLANDMDKINEAFSLMDEETSKRVMDECQRTGLISVLSEEEAKQYLDQDHLATDEQKPKVALRITSIS
jgi:hypothetical protein